LAAPKHGGKECRKALVINILPPPYFFRAVRSFGEYGAERDEIRPHGHFGSQELLAKKLANTGDFRRSVFAERDLPRGYVAEGKVLETNRLGGE